MSDTSKTDEAERVAESRPVGASSITGKTDRDGSHFSQILSGLLDEGELPEETLQELYVTRGVEAELMDFAEETRLPDEGPLVLVGDVGVGKTATLQYVAQQLRRDPKSKVAFVDARHWAHMSGDRVSEALVAAIPHDATLLLDNLDVLPEKEVARIFRTLRSQRRSGKAIVALRGQTSERMQSSGFRFPGQRENTVRLDKFSPKTVAVIQKRLAEAGIDLPDTDEGTLQRLDVANGHNLRRILGLLATGYEAGSLEQLLEPFRFAPQPLLQPVRPQIVTELREVNEDLYRFLAGDPMSLQRLDPALFEKLVADLLDRRGYKVTLTPQSGDGGIDIYASKDDGAHKYLLVVQCKRYALNRPVEAAVVRELWGSLDLAKASAGLVATSSVFRKGAQELQKQLHHRISLKDYLDLNGWILEANPAPSR